MNGVLLFLFDRKAPPQEENPAGQDSFLNQNRKMRGKL